MAKILNNDPVIMHIGLYIIINLIYIQINIHHIKQKQMHRHQ